jgi:hypothetical protein
MASDKLELIIDLEDGLPPARVETIDKARPTGPGALIHKAPPQVTITRTPMAVVISYAHVHCLGCGADHKDHRGIFLDEKLSNGVRALSRKSLREIGPFSELPRRVDVAPAEAIPICSDCWLNERSFKDAVAAAQVSAEIPLDPATPTPLQELGEKLDSTLTTTTTKENQLEP